MMDSDYPEYADVLKHCFTSSLFTLDIPNVCKGCPYNGTKSCAYVIGDEADEANKQLLARIEELRAREEA